jgi:hypothetical protein
MKLKNCCANSSSLIRAGCTSSSWLLCFLYICLSSMNPSFHDAIEEITHVWPWYSLDSRVALSWSFSRCSVNSPVFSLSMRVLAFLITSVTSELEVINYSLSSIREQPRMKFFMHNVQPSKGSDIPAARLSCSFFVHFGITALYPPGPSLCMNLFFLLSSFIFLLSAMASRLVRCCWKVFHSLGVINPNQFNGDLPVWT